MENSDTTTIDEKGKELEDTAEQLENSQKEDEQENISNSAQDSDEQKQTETNPDEVKVSSPVQDVGEGNKDDEVEENKNEEGDKQEHEEKDEDKSIEDISNQPTDPATDTDVKDSEETKMEEKEDEVEDEPDNKEENTQDENINENASTQGEAKNSDELETAEGEEKEKEPLIPDDFFYNFEEFVSRPVITEESGLPEDMLKIQHSFGYDCTKRYNLFMLDERTVIFIAGNLVQILDLQTKEQKYIRSTSAGGIGALAVHPSRQYFAIGEKGHAPNINIFEYPSLKLYRILRGGTEQSYASLNFSPDGELLASQGGDPDFMLTVWKWQQEKTVLRSKAFSQDVFRVTFSTELEGQLTTAGTGHIRFWKMADTFTGLKLQGELGKFGKTEISDIEGYVELPDGKVLSGCESGNMIVWDGGLIKVEIARRNKKTCHVGAIQQILLDEGELMTIGVDGYIRVWDFETIDTADASDESGQFEMEPMNELRVGYDVQLRSIVKSVDSENEPTIWYAQDANGGIWKLDLSFSHTSHAPEKMFTYHAGPILGCDTSPKSHLVATTGNDQTVRVFDCLQKKQLSQSKFSTGGTALLWAPQIVDKKTGTLIVGFHDGVVRILTVSASDGKKRNKQDCDLILEYAFKPHNKKVTSLAVDPTGLFLASGGADSTVFFMTIGDSYDPIGFVETPAPVKKVIWSPSSFNKQTLLVICEEGYVVEFDTPDPSKIDSSHSYKIGEFVSRVYKFNSIKSHLRHEEELERKRIEEEEKRKKEEEERRKRIDRGIETESEQGEEEDEEKVEEKLEEWQPYIPEEPSPILDAMYCEEGQFWLSMGEFDAGYLYKCKFSSEQEKSSVTEDKIDQPIKAIPMTDTNDEPITIMKFSANGKQAIFGFQNGSIRIQQLESDFDISTMKAFWRLNVHDNNYGHITGVSLSYDGLFLMSVGEDGNFFMFDYMPQEQLEKKITENKAKIPSAKRKYDDQKPQDDIDDPNAYSIEDAKQKAEYDKRMKEAEEKKRDVRRQIAKQRRIFKTLLEQNEALPKHLQLEKLEFEMDREIKLELEKHTRDKIDEVRKQLAWESEKQRIALEKIRKRFKDGVECERIVVKAFQTQHAVSSFRASKLSEDFYQLRADYERRRTLVMSREDLTRDPTRNLLTGQTKASESESAVEKTDETDAQKIFTSLKGSMGERISQALNKVEDKKKKRAQRRSQWDDLYRGKPDDNYEDPADVAAIAEAKDNMGDFKLKTAADYVVPDHLRMNVEKARGRLLVLKDLIHELKYKFNTRLLGLRDKKIKVIDHIKDYVARLNEVHALLSADKIKPVPIIPDIHEEEMPEKKLEYTREILISFKKELLHRENAIKKGDSAQAFGGFGGGGGGNLSEQKGPPSVTGLTQKQSSTVSSLSKDTLLEKQDTAIAEEEIQLSPLELQLREAEEIRLLYEQDYLLNQIQELVKKFDAELRLLRHDKFQMDIVMKNADLRQVTLFEELVLLKEYEKREDVLAAKVMGKQQERLDMQAKVLDCQAKLDSKKKDIEKLQEKEKALHTTFLGSLGENNKFGDYLTKVFKKKIKRAKKKANEGQGSDDESESESEDESDLDESDEESESESGGYDLDVCPSGCDQTIYDTTCQLREKRLDIEEDLTEEKKVNEALKKELENLSKKAKVIESALKTAQNDLEAFQLEKQQKLNELDVVVTVRLHQIQYMINGLLPQDLSSTLVFEACGVTRLQHRIKELEHEKINQKKQMKESRRTHVQLIKDRKLFDNKITELEDQCNQMMIGKFGRIVDLEKLETVTVNRQIEELKEKLRVTEIQCSEEMTDWDDHIKDKKIKITELIKANTDRLDQLCMLLGERKTLEGSLDSRQKNLGVEYTGQRKADVREKQRLIQLVQLQAQEIDALKEEIMLLSHKGGHILPPAQPPLPTSPQNIPL